MTSTSMLKIFRSNRKNVYAVFFLAFVAVLIVGMSVRSSHAPFASAEVQFTDPSAHGMHIVPASCPSSPHYTGECVGSGGGGGSGCAIGYTPAAGGTCVFAGCPLGYALSGYRCIFTICPAGYRLVGNQCSQLTCPAGYTVVRDNLGDNCVAPPSINFTNFVAANPNGSFTASGHLQVIPILVKSGETVQVYWNVANASSCTVAGNNGDSWSTNSSGTAGQTSKPVTTQTTFTLSCAALLGATPPGVNESQVVNIVPVFNER